MENNRLSDFFRKRLNEDTTKQDWANPDVKVDNLVLVNIAELNKSSVSKWKSITLKSLAGLIFIALIGSVFYLNQKSKTDNIEFTDEIDKYKKALSISKNQQNISKSNNLKNAREVSSLQNEKKKLKIENKNLIQLNKHKENRKRKIEKQLNQSHLIFTQIQNENIMIKDSLEHLTEQMAIYNLEYEQTFQELLGSKDSLKQLASLTKKEKIILEPKEKTSNEQNNNSSFNNYRYSFGYDLTSQKWNIPQHTAFQEQKLISEGKQSNIISSNVNGLNFAFSPKKNWWIRTGVRFSKMNIENSYNLGLAYSNKNERMDSSREGTFNTINIKKSTPFSPRTNL